MARRSCICITPHFSLRADAPLSRPGTVPSYTTDNGFMTGKLVTPHTDNSMSCLTSLVPGCVTDNDFTTEI
ncbi:hypothetical protein M404DRAFT_995113 [Pisolithus tinctorius Marx 270]|uniref:Uncharacterized protein n=1 Tax=Pisolithus tinctorius Marx 270 TaxID=870435 RepID=A0A0C3KLY1_PISTI|nr:hypothetical protein M404DRAFT_995113 [Pisolithus tinctorius Marx 270]